MRGFGKGEGSLLLCGFIGRGAMRGVRRRGKRTWGKRRCILLKTSCRLDWGDMRGEFDLPRNLVSVSH